MGVRPSGTSITAARNEIASKLGEEPESIRLFRANWKEYMQDGVIVKLHISYWQGSAILSNRDIGLPEKARSKLISLGKKRLYPIIPQTSKFYSKGKAGRTYQELLHTEVTKIRNRLNIRYSYPTPFGPFVPYSVWFDFKQEFEASQQTFHDVRDELVENWDAMIESICDEYTVEAQRAFFHRKAIAVADTDDQFAQEMSEFVQKYLDAIKSLIISKEEFFNSFSIEKFIFQIPLQTLLAQDALEASRIQAEIDIVEENRKAEVAKSRIEIDEAQAERMRRIEIVDAKKQAELDVIEAERRANMSTAEMLELQKREANADAIAEMRKQMENTVLETTKSMLGKLATFALKDLYNIAAYVGKDDVMSKRSRTSMSAALPALIDQLSKLNYFDNPTIDALVKDLNEKVNVEESTAEEVMQAFKGAQARARALLMDVGSFDEESEKFMIDLEFDTVDSNEFDTGDSFDIELEFTEVKESVW